MRRNPISILEKIPHRTWSIHEDNFCKRHNNILGMSTSGQDQSNNITQGEIRIEKPSQKFRPFRDAIDEGIPPPLDRIVDVNTKRKSVIYEVALGRDLAFELMDSMVMDGNCTVVGEVSFKAIPSLSMLTKLLIILAYSNMQPKTLGFSSR